MARLLTRVLFLAQIECACRSVQRLHRLSDPRWDWKGYPIGFKTRPIIIGELLPGEPIHIFESQWDAFAFMDKSGERTGIIITLGSENGKLVARLIPAGTTVYAWKQNDELKN